MRGATVCSGIGAPETAMPHWQWQFCAEIEPFPSAALAHHYPNVPNRGDMTRFKEWPDAAIDVLVGGTPCQSFSVAGLRKGLDDPRGNLALVFLALADRYRSEWVVWENVPGVLSSSGGRDFGAFLGGLGELGYGWAYRCLDAQWFGLAQRRKRVFVVAHLGDWRRAASVLFEPEGLRGDTAPSREAGERVAPTISARPTGGGGLGTDFDCDGGLIAAPLMAKDGRGVHSDMTNFVAQPYTLAIRGRGDGHDLEYRQDGVANAVLTPNGGRGGIGVGAVAFQSKASASQSMNPSEVAPSMDVGNDGLAVAFQEVGKRTGTSTTDPRAGIGISEPGEPMFTLQAGAQHGVGTETAVRRLTPRECARLQGFPDNYLDITYRGKPVADGPKYRALGNSMAVPVVQWILRRIELANAVTAHLEAAE